MTERRMTEKEWEETREYYKKRGRRMKEYVKLKVDTYTDLVRENVALTKRNTDLIIECHEKDEIIETQKKVNNNLARTQRIMWDFLEEIKMRKECENYVKVAEEGKDDE